MRRYLTSLPWGMATLVVAAIAGPTVATNGPHWIAVPLGVAAGALVLATGVTVNVLYERRNVDRHDTP